MLWVQSSVSKITWTTLDGILHSRTVFEKQQILVLYVPIYICTDSHINPGNPAAQINIKTQLISAVIWQMRQWGSRNIKWGIKQKSQKTQVHTAGNRIFILGRPELCNGSLNWAICQQNVFSCEQTFKMWLSSIVCLIYKMPYHDKGWLLLKNCKCYFTQHVVYVCVFWRRRCTGVTLEGLSIAKLTKPGHHF